MDGGPAWLACRFVPVPRSLAVQTLSLPRNKTGSRRQIARSPTLPAPPMPQGRGTGTVVAAPGVVAPAR